MRNTVNISNRKKGGRRMRKNDKHIKISYKTLRKEDDAKIRFHGTKLPKWIATPGISLWIKVYFYILWWYVQHPGKVFFKNWSTICNDFIACGCVCTVEGIRDAIQVLKNSETEERYLTGKMKGKKKKGGVGLINVVYNEELKSECAMPEEYIYRKVYVDMKKARKLLSIFTADTAYVKQLKSKSRLKKLIFNRPLSIFTKTVAASIKRQLNESKEKYTSEEQMFFGFVEKYSSKKFDASALLRNHKSRQTINLQEEQDMENWLKLNANSANKLHHVIDDDTGEIIDPPGQTPTEVVKSFYEAIR